VGCGSAVDDGNGHDRFAQPSLIIITIYDMLGMRKVVVAPWMRKMVVRDMKTTEDVDVHAADARKVTEEVT